MSDLCFTNEKTTKRPRDRWGRPRRPTTFVCPGPACHKRFSRSLPLKKHLHDAHMTPPTRVLPFSPEPFVSTPGAERNGISLRLEDIDKWVAPMAALYDTIYKALRHSCLRGQQEPWGVNVETRLTPEDWQLVETVLEEDGLVVQERSDHRLVLVHDKASVK